MAISTPNTSTVTSHGLLIQSAAEIVGAITKYTVKHTQATKDLYEFGSGTTLGGGDDVEADRGEAFETIPNNIGGTDISIGRYDQYKTRFEKAFAKQGVPDLVMLSKQVQSIRFVDVTVAPDKTLSFKRVHFGAWFTSIGRNYSAEGDRSVMVDANAHYTRTREFNGL